MKAVQLKRESFHNSIKKNKL